MTRRAILQPGITHIALSTDPLVFAPQIDWEQFKKTCYLAARNYGAKYIQLRGSYPDNYRTVWFSHKYDPAKRILGMINIYYPLMGFLLIDGNEFDNVDENGIPERFGFGGWSFNNYPIFEDTDLTYWFSQSSYRILSRDELCEPLEFEVKSKIISKGERQKIITLKNKHELRSDDIEDLHSFRPRIRNIADAIFGSFD